MAGVDILKKNKWLGYSLGLAVLLLAAFFLNKFWGPKQNITTTNQGGVTVQREVLPAGKKPSIFPEDLPLEADAEIIQNENVGINGIRQGRMQFITKKTAAENFDIYKNYLTNNQWEIVSTADTEGFKSITARKGYYTFSGIFETNSLTLKNNVNLAIENR